MTDANRRVAWRVAVDGEACIVYHTTRAKAKWVAVAAWRLAGYGSDGRWPHVGCARAPELDNGPLWSEQPCAYREDYARGMAW